MQPVLLTISASLSQSIDAAAEADAVNESTVHYGKLSKNVALTVENAASTWLTSLELAWFVAGAVFTTAPPGSLVACEVDVFYPKASMLGDGAGYIRSVDNFNDTISRVLYLKNVRIPCIIGVNIHERLLKQPVVVNLWVDCLPVHQTDEYTKVEQLLINTIESSSFETLESLATMVVAQLRRDIFHPDGGANIRLRVEKPMAVPFADAPAIEIFRPASKA